VVKKARIGTKQMMGSFRGQDAGGRGIDGITAWAPDRDHAAAWSPDQAPLPNQSGWQGKQIVCNERMRGRGLLRELFSAYRSCLCNRVLEK
jgi:uncharacterized protein (DUF2235 family)